jgi:hypothetical protein
MADTDVGLGYVIIRLLLIHTKYMNVIIIYI